MMLVECLRVLKIKVKSFLNIKKMAKKGKIKGKSVELVDLF